MASGVQMGGGCACAREFSNEPDQRLLQSADMMMTRRRWEKLGGETAKASPFELAFFFVRQTHGQAPWKQICSLQV
jgi:hypothetical protein